MDQSLVQTTVDDMLEPVSEFDELVEIVEQATAPVRVLPSYRVTRWGIVNQTLDIVDSVTNGRAGLLQRLFSYLFFGGSAAIVNLGVFFVMMHFVPLPGDESIHNIIASVVACEISLMANFIPNDYFTFRHLNQTRSWLSRCARFHATALVGSVLTILLQMLFTNVCHFFPLVGQALAIILVLFYNFTFHHLFTYGHKKVKSQVA